MKDQNRHYETRVEIVRTWSSMDRPPRPLLIDACWLLLEADAGSKPRAIWKFAAYAVGCLYRRVKFRLTIVRYRLKYGVSDETARMMFLDDLEKADIQRDAEAEKQHAG
jgi:hypothetical protein